MPENRKSVVVDIVSDSKRFLSGFEEAIKEIEKVAKKADILGSIQDDVDGLKQSIVGISKSISNIKPATDDSAIQNLQKKMDSLDNSVKHLKQNVKDIKFDVNETSGKNIEKQTNSIKNEVMELIGQMREASSFMTELFNIKGNISSNGISKASSDLESYNKKLNELKSIQESLKAKDTTIYSKMKFKEAEEELERYKDKYIELELEINNLNSKINSGSLKDNEKTIATKKLNDYKVGLASVSREIIDIQDRLTESKTFNGDFFDISKLQKNINSVEKILISRITYITNKINDISKEANSTISTNTLELKDGKINIPIEIDKTATKLKNILQNILNELQATVNPVTVPIQLVSAYKTNTKKEVAELKEIKALQDGIDQLTDENQKNLAQSTLDKIKAQFQKELRIDIKTNISEAEKDIERGISKIKKILKDSGIIIHPVIELTDENKKKFQQQLQELSKVLSNDFGSDLTSLRDEIEKLTNEDSLSNWGNKFISILNQIGKRIDSFNENLKQNNLYETLKGWDDANTILRNNRITKKYDDGRTDGISGTGELERYMFLNTKTGVTSNSYIYDQLDSVSNDIINGLIKLENGLERYNTAIHTHPVEHPSWKDAGYKEIGSNLSFSNEDVMSYQEYLKQGIDKLMVLSNGKINELDLSSIDEKIVDKILKEYIELLSSRNTNDPKYYKQFINGKTVNHDIVSKIDNDAFAKIIAKHTKQDASNFIKQYDIDSLKNISELSQEAQTLEKVVDLLSKISSNILSINNSGIQLDVSSFDKIRVSLDKINSSLENMILLIQRATGVSSDLELDNQFENIRKKFYDISNVDGSFDARKKEVRELISEYQKYLDMGGKQSISDLTENEKSQKKLLELLNKQIHVQNELQQANSNKYSSNLKTTQETKEISNLANVIDDVVRKINDKTEAFKQEQKVVSTTIPDETEKIGKLISALNHVKRVLEDIGSNSKESGLSRLSELSELNKLKPEKFSAISTALSSLADNINKLSVNDNSFLSSINDILLKADELKSLASILKESNNKINSVKNVVNSSSSSDISSTELVTVPRQNVKNFEKEAKESANALQLVEQARRDAYGNAEHYESEVIDDTHELIKVYRQAKSEYESGQKTYQDAYENMRKGFEAFYTKQGFEYSSADINLDASFGFKSANIKVYNDELKQTIVDYYRLDKESKQILRTGIQLKDNGTQRAKAIKDENNQIEKARENLKKYLAGFDNKTLGQMQDNETYKKLSSFNIENLDDIEKAKTLMIQLDTIYTSIMSNARKGTTGLNPFVNMVSNIDKAQNALKSVKISFNDLSYDTGNLKDKIDILEDTLNKVINAKGIEEKSKYYGEFRQQINLITNDLQTQKQQESKVDEILLKQIKSLNNIFDLRSKIIQLESVGKNNEANIYYEKLKAEQQVYNILGKELDSYSDIISNEERRNVLKNEAAKAELKVKGALAQVADSDALNKQKEQKNQITKHNQDIIVAYKERNKQTKEYYELLEKVKSDTATDTEFERLNKIIEQWDKAINKKDEYNIQSGGNSEVEANAKKVQDEFINSQSLNYSTMVDNYIQGAKTILNKLNQYNFTDDFQVKINEASKIINNLKLPLDIINEQESIRDIGLLKNLMSEINGGWKVDSNRISNETAFYKLQGKIVDTLKENTAMSSKLKKDFRELQQEMERWGTSIPSNELKKLSSRFFELDTEMKKAGKTGRSFFDMVTNKAIHMSSAFIGQYLSLYDFVRYAQQAYQYVAEIDKQMIELEKVSDMSASRLAESFDHAKESAKDLGSTVSDVIAATADWSRLGYDADAAEQLAEVATIYKNVGDGIDISTANESLISTLQGFQMEASQAMEIVDSFNEVANRMPIDSAGIGEALQRSAASFNAANTDLNSSIALITATNAVIQDPERVGNMWKTVSMRIRGATAELEEAGLETDGMVESTSQLRELIKSMTGFDIMVDDSTYKDIKEIVVGIGKEWDKLSDIDQAALLEKLAGKTQGNALAAALSNWQMIEEAYAIAENSSGSAMKEQEKWEQGLEARTNKLKASLETLSTTLLDSDFLGGAIDAGRGFIDILTAIIDKLGVIPTLLAGIGGGFGIFKSIQGDGKWGFKNRPHFKKLNMPSVVYALMET